jgi:quinoprotein glucose dehydrogenase
VFVLNRLTGVPWFGVEERPVPASSIPEEQASQTQPFPMKPPPIARQSMTADELTNVTPESRAECSAILAQAHVLGAFFQPWSLDYTLNFPGGNGGANWGGASYDAQANLVFVNTMDVGVIVKLEKAPAGSKLPYRFRGAPHTVFWDSQHYPCQRPPWGSLTAIDLSDGSLRWRVPLGSFPELDRRAVPPTGTPNIGGSIVTAGGIVFIGASNDSRLHAFDETTGRELWSATLPASGHATPMTFLGDRSGKQFLVIAAGGGNRYSERFSDALVAFTLR